MRSDCCSSAFSFSFFRTFTDNKYIAGTQTGSDTSSFLPLQKNNSSGSEVLMPFFAEAINVQKSYLMACQPIEQIHKRRKR